MNKPGCSSFNRFVTTMMNQAICKLPQDAPYSLVEEKLGSIIENGKQYIKHSLLIACSNGRLEVVRYLLRRLKLSEDDKVTFNDTNTRTRNILAIVDEKSGNSLFHFASISSNYRSEILDLLMVHYCNFTFTDRDLPRQRIVEVAKVNNHGDTPIMMAAAYDYTDALNLWMGVRNHMENIPILHQRNNEGFTALTLAANHGNLKTVKLLVQCCAQDIDRVKVKDVILRLEIAMKNARSPQQRATMKVKLGQIRSCLGVIDTEQNRISTALYEELLVEEDIKQQQQKHHDKKTNNHTKKHKRKGSNKQHGNSHSVPQQQRQHSNPPQALKKLSSDKNTDVMFTQLPNGTRAVSVLGTTAIEEECPNVIHSIQQSKPSAEELFQQRIEATLALTNSNERQSTPTRIQSSNNTTSATDKLKALCLDASQLLLSPHGMAMLSAAQLDSIEEVLRSQLATVESARDIQHRLHATANCLD